VPCKGVFLLFWVTEKTKFCTKKYQKLSGAGNCHLLLWGEGYPAARPDSSTRQMQLLDRPMGL